jgi:hypothetical protein
MKVRERLTSARVPVRSPEMQPDVELRRASGGFWMAAMPRR